MGSFPRGREGGRLISIKGSVGCKPQFVKSQLDWLRVLLGGLLKMILSERGGKRAGYNP